MRLFTRQGIIGLGTFALASLLPLRALAQINEGQLQLTTKTSGSLPDLINTIITVLGFVAGAIAVIYLVVSGIQYMTAGGNAEAATKARQGIINALIGIVIVVFAFVIFRFIVSKIQ